MIRVIVRQARPGMSLARTILNPRQPDQVLLAAGYELTAPVIARLHELGVYDFWVNYPGLDFLDDMISPDLSAHQQRLCDALKQGFHSQAQRTDSKLPIGECRAVVQDLSQTLMANVKDMAFISDLTAVDDALLRHSAEVCYLAVMMGLRLENYLLAQRKRLTTRRAKDIVNLGVGAMLHDIGEIKLPEAQRESRRLAGDESDHWKKHVILGYEAIRHQADPSASNIVLNHHQHFDGTGFPLVGSGMARCAQSGNQIHVFSRIATVADTFQHFLRHDGHAMPTIFALWKIQQHPFCNWFDPTVAEALHSVAPPFPPGVIVQLSDRRNAVVIKHHPETPCYPVVQVLQTFGINGIEAQDKEVIDLAQQNQLFIDGVDGFAITPYLYGPQKLPVINNKSQPTVHVPLQVAVLA